jgi:hypothetical protein
MFALIDRVHENFAPIQVPLAVILFSSPFHVVVVARRPSRRPDMSTQRCNTQ